MPSAKRIVLALSGGVDSAVSAVLLRDAGHDVHALFMRNWDEDEDGYCTAAADLQDARRVCDDLQIPLHTVSFAAEYRDRVFSHFLAELNAGRTPNPDVACNREIKFGVCFAHALRLGADLFATGHYARMVDGRLQRGIDPGKDQTYFLHSVPGAMLARTLFPIGDLPKSEVRRIAHARGLAVHDKRDSTGICFIGERPFAEFLETYLPARPGPIETPAGRPLGTHRGLMYYTLGQRQGLEAGRRARRGGKAVVRGAQGPRAQRAGRGPGGRPSAAAGRPVRDRGRRLDRRGATTGYDNRHAYVHREAALPPA